MLSLLTAIIVYTIRQSLFRQPIKWQNLVYIIVLVLYTNPILEQSIAKLSNGKNLPYNFLINSLMLKVS